MSARVIAITGGKGGVGKSTTTVNLAVSLRLDGFDVGVVDTDIEMPNLVEMLGLEPKTTIHDVLSGRAETSEATIDLGNGFSVVPGDPALSGFATVEPSKLKEVVDELRTLKEVVILDTGAGLSYDDVLPLSLADEVIVVTSPDPAAVQNAARTEAFVHRLNQTVAGVVVTRATGPIDTEVKDAFEAQIVGVIPEDPAVRKSTAAGQPLEVYDASSPAAEAYRKLEAALTDGSLPPSSGRAPGDTADDGTKDAAAEAKSPRPATVQEPQQPGEGASPGDQATAKSPSEDTEAMDTGGEVPREEDVPEPEVADPGEESDEDHEETVASDAGTADDDGPAAESVERDEAVTAETESADGDVADPPADKGADEAGKDGLFARLVKRLGA